MQEGMLETKQPAVKSIPAFILSLLQLENHFPTVLQN